jgi:hypothetical protein
MSSLDGATHKAFFVTTAKAKDLARLWHYDIRAKAKALD